MTPYAQKLRDPRWQRRRLEIMQRDNFECCDCRDKDKTLNVHHSVYRRAVEPWDYPDDELHTLCEDCHALRHSQMEKLQHYFGLIRNQYARDQLVGAALQMVCDVIEGETHELLMKSKHEFASQFELYGFIQQRFTSGCSQFVDFLRGEMVDTQGERFRADCSIRQLDQVVLELAVRHRQSHEHRMREPSPVFEPIGLE